MSTSFNNNYQNSSFVKDAAETKTTPDNGELFTATHVQNFADEIYGMAYALGAPGLRGTANPIWGSHQALTGYATSSGTTIVFTATQTALTVGSLIAGAIPTTTGWRRITDSGLGITMTVNAAFDSTLASETVYLHGTAAKRIDALAAAGVIYPPNFLTGFTLANSAGDPTNDIDIAAGSCRDSTDAANIVLGSSITKRLDAAWAVGTNQGGLDTGSIANTTYHMWAIKRSDTGVVDVLFSTSVTSPTMPSNYDYKCLIGSIIREGGAIVAFKQIGNWFQRSIPKQDVSANNPGTSGTLRTLSVPIGIKVKAKVRWIFSYAAGGTGVHAVVSSPDETDAAPSATATPGANASQFGSDAGRNFQHAVELETFTNTSGQVRTRVDYSDANLDIYGVTVGWYHPRGQW